MTIPRATYRIQFHRGFGLRDAMELIPYLDAIGVSHVYASPLLKARPGSTHGYDVCDPRQINLEIGTETDLDAFVSALRERGMGLVLDIVPNHLAAAPENPWWWDVLKHGRRSRFAGYFDIDWEPADPGSRGKVLLPVLGGEYERVLDQGELKVVCERAEVMVRYFEHRFPVSPESILVPGRFLEEAVAEFNCHRKALAEFLDQQHYRLAFWRHGDTELNYRRFFTVNHLVGVRVEQPQVFTDTHNLILEWHQRGLLDGLRVDHPDGLRNPEDYLQRLQQAAPGAWIIVEKILEPGENLPAGWPTAGTTGYDFLNRVTGLFIDPLGERRLTDFYAEFTGEPMDYPLLAREKKRWILRHDLRADVVRLTRLSRCSAAECDRDRCRDFERLQEALEELVACFPVYRSYVPLEMGTRATQPVAGSQPEWLAATDDAHVKDALAAAKRERPDLTALLEYLGDLILQRGQCGKAVEFVARFQQLTGPAMAKGVEDTAYYCFNRFVALNEVGGDPARFALSLEEFHCACIEAQRQWPHTMLTTSTHDTKRSEDVRARLTLLSEIPEQWAAAVKCWSALNIKHHRDGWPDRNTEYLFYQTIVGAWPLPIERAVAYMEKAAREAKQHTNWTDRNLAYEAALGHFVTNALADQSFLAEVERFVTPILRAGYINSLAQTLLKLTAPGVPDIYQGTDLWDFSLVDPDNRRPVDFAVRRDVLIEIQRRLNNGEGKHLAGELMQSPTDGRAKLYLIHQTLTFRRQHGPLFRDGRYQPSFAEGRRADHVCAFTRSWGNAAAITVVPRLLLGLTGGDCSELLTGETWENTRLILSPRRGNRAFRNVFTGEVLCAQNHGAAASLRLSDVLRGFPVALLEKLECP